MTDEQDEPTIHNYPWPTTVAQELLNERDTAIALRDAAEATEKDAWLARDRAIKQRNEAEADRDSWRRTAERLEKEKIDIRAKLDCDTYPDDDEMAVEDRIVAERACLRVELRKSREAHAIAEQKVDELLHATADRGAVEPESRDDEERFGSGVLRKFMRDGWPVERLPTPLESAVYELCRRALEGGQS